MSNVSLPVSKPKRMKKPDYSKFSRSKRYTGYSIGYNKLVRNPLKKIGLVAVNLMLSPSSQMRDARIRTGHNAWTGLKNPYPKNKSKKFMGKTKANSPFVFKANDPNNTQNRVSPFNKEFWKQPYGRGK